MSLPRVQRLLSEPCRRHSQHCVQSRFYASSAKSAPRTTGSTTTKQQQPPRPAVRAKATTNITSGAADSTIGGSPSTVDALRTAEAREGALRAARMRRLAQRVDMEKEQVAKDEAQAAYDKRYKTASRKWVSSMIALPILLVTSYYLFDRCKFSFCIPY